VNSDCFQEEKAKMIQTLLFVAGLNTFFQTFFGTRLPAVIGGSFSYLPATISIVLAGRYSEILDPVEVTFGSLPYVDTALLNFVLVCFLIVQLCCRDLKRQCVEFKVRSLLPQLSRLSWASVAFGEMLQGLINPG
jgi:xanthine/uracil permease